MKELIRKLLRAINLERKVRAYLSDFSRAELRMLFHLRRALAGTDRKIIGQYFQNNKIRKLQIACGANAIDGWLNSDYYRRSNEVLHLDATKDFPFESNQFDFVFCEHMIEHIEYQQGLQMLSECFRVLKPNGKIRLSTPDLAFLINLYRNNKSELQLEFIKHSIEAHVKWAPSYEAPFVINNYMRAWGHKFIYDEKILRNSLEKVGFAGITRHNICESEDKALQNLENISRKSSKLLNLESIVMEGTKP